MKESFLVDFNIPFPSVLIIDELGKIMGTFALREGIREARKRKMNLVCVSPKENPPVCKIADLGKLLYKESKKKKVNKGPKIKEESISTKIGDHDLWTKGKRMIRFIKKGDKIRLRIWVKGYQSEALGDKKKEFLSKVEKFFLKNSLETMVTILKEKKRYLIVEINPVIRK